MLIGDLQATDDRWTRRLGQAPLLTSEGQRTEAAAAHLRFFRRSLISPDASKASIHPQVSVIDMVVADAPEFWDLSRANQEYCVARSMMTRPKELRGSKELEERLPWSALERFMATRGLTPASWGRKAGVSSSAFYEWKRLGFANAQIRTYTKLAKAVEMPIDRFFYMSCMERFPRAAACCSW